MKKTMKIEGMMCPHCENRVKKSLEALECVEKAQVSHAAGTAELSGDALDNAALTAAVESAGYKVLSISEG